MRGKGEGGHKFLSFSHSLEIIKFSFVSQLEMGRNYTMSVREKRRPHNSSIFHNRGEVLGRKGGWEGEGGSSLEVLNIQDAAGERGMIYCPYVRVV